MAHTPIRMCVACRRRRPRHELVRMAAGRGGVRLDVQRRLPGRGAYICPDPTCVAAAKRRGARVVRQALRAGDEYEVVHEVVHEVASVLSRIRDGQTETPEEQET